MVSECSADIHAENDYAVGWAALNGHLKVVRYLVSQGADIHAADDYAVQMASRYGHLEVVQYLVSKCLADIHAEDDEAVQVASQNGYLDVVRYLVSQGASIINISEFHRRYATIYMKHHKRSETRAASRIYFWWIQQCYPLSRPSGIRMAYQNLAEYEAMCTL